MRVPFDPLSYENLGGSISRALDEEIVEPLAELKRFDGAGVYALYYTGDFPSYAPLARANQHEPGSWAIYIGKAEAESARKGDPDQTSTLDGPRLFNRIRNHLRSIQKVHNLDENDFLVRALVVAPTWVPLAEAVSIRLHHPLWNVLVDGLGNHDPGAGRREGMRPRWDTIHPGREWATKLPPRPESVGAIEQEALQYLHAEAHRFPPNV